MKKHVIYVVCLLLTVMTLPSIYADTCCPDTTGSAACSSDCKGSCECQVTNKSFLSIRPFFEAASPAKIALVRNEMQELRCHNGSLFQIVPFGGKTMRSDLLAQYFGPSCKRSLLVMETPETQAEIEATDILSQQLNITTVNGNFKSIFNVSPEQVFAGIGFNYRTHFGYKDQNKGFFIDITIPVYYVRNHMNLCENIINNGGGAATDQNVDSVAAAFRQSEWCFGQINDCVDDTHVGISEIDLQLGYGWGKEQAFMHSYIGIIVPTGNKVRGHKVFEPIIGWDHNTAFHFGSSLGIELWHSECKNYAIWYELAIDSRYFFENTQIRSFDLQNKPWSRYMMVYSNLDQATIANVAPIPANVQIGTPGINLFTQPLKIRPRFQRTYNTAFALDMVNWTLEGGYNFFCRDAECVKLACPWDQIANVKYNNENGVLVATDGPALKSLNGNGNTDSVQLISNNYQLINAKPLADYAENVILASDLDLSSAQAPALLSQRFYASAGYSVDSCGFTTLFGLGGEYEFAGDNTGINRWGLWGKVAFIF